MIIRDVDKDLLKAMAARLRKRANEIREQVVPSDIRTMPAFYGDPQAANFQLLTANVLAEQADIYEDMAK